MKRVFKQNGKFLIKWSIVLIVSIVLFYVLHDIATDKRQYDAIGGEIFMFLIPFFVWLAPKIKKINKGD